MTDVFREHLNTVYRLAYTFMGSRRDAEAAASTAFAKLMQSGERNYDAEQERAWLIDAVIGACYGMLSRDREDGGTRSEAPADKALEAMVSLPGKYKAAAYLFFCEGLTAREIAAALGEDPGTVTTAVNKSRRLLKAKLGGDFDA